MPSWRYARVVSPIVSVGKSAKQIEMSIAVMTSSTSLGEPLDVEGVVVAEELQQVEQARLHEELSR